ncbi:MAG: radical SAM protein [Acidobacteria bacterium]|nr:MAG: radical SAM protein [Acidobacteriota bacterium]
MSGPELPSYVQLEPVGQCNLKCTMCPIQFRTDGRPGTPPAFMDFDTFVRLIDGFPGLRDLHLQGLGEPMMHPRFFDMVSLAASRGIRVTTNTNLTLLGPRRAERLVTCGLDCLHASVDGATEETYNSIRIGGKLSRVLGNLRAFVQARARLGSATPRLHLVMVLMRRNLHELSAMVRLAADMDAEQLFVQHLCHDFSEPGLPSAYNSMREFVDAETLAHESPALVSWAFAEARGEAASLGVGLRLPRVAPREHPPGTPGRQRCSWPWTGAYVSYQGLAMPCCMISTPDRLNFGNMADHGVPAIWHGREYEAFRHSLDSDDPPAICRSCSVYKGTF